MERDISIHMIRVVMITYEQIKLAAEIIAFVSITGILYLMYLLRRMLRELLGVQTFRGIAAGALIVWLGYMTNVLNDVFPTEFMKVIDDVIVTAGIIIMFLSTVKIGKQVLTSVRPRVVLNGESGIQPGAYLLKPTSPQMIIKNLSGKKVLAVTRTAQAYESLGIPYLWITNVEHPKAMSPTSLAPLMHTILENADENTFVIFDGLEYLILQNGFQTTLKFLVSLKDALLAKGAGIVLVIDPETLEKKQLAIIEREFKWMGK